MRQSSIFIDRLNHERRKIKSKERKLKRHKKRNQKRRGKGREKEIQNTIDNVLVESVGGIQNRRDDGFG